jgi:hypothetical protein
MANTLTDIINNVRQLAKLPLESLAKDLESVAAMTVHVEELKAQRASLLAETATLTMKLDSIKAARGVEEKAVAALKEAQVIVRDETKALKGYLVDMKAKVAAIL